MDLPVVEGVVGALSYSAPGDLLAGEGNQGLAAALAAEVVQDENGVWLELQRKKENGDERHMRQLRVTSLSAAAP